MGTSWRPTPAGRSAAGGKRLRPLLVFLCADGRDGERLVAAARGGRAAAHGHPGARRRARPRRAAPRAARRCSPRVGARRPPPPATCCSRARSPSWRPPGAPRPCGRSRARRSALVRGELMQRADAWSEDVTPERYLERCRLKTASLFEASCRMGALLGGDAARRTPLGRFGERVGLAFQLLDDVLDVSGPARAHRQAARDRPAGRHGHAAADPRPPARPRARRPRPAPVVDRARPGGGGVRPHRDVRGPGRGARRGAAPRGRSQGCADRYGAAGWPPRALDLVADGVVERYA